MLSENFILVHVPHVNVIFGNGEKIVKNYSGFSIQFWNKTETSYTPDEVGTIGINGLPK